MIKKLFIGDITTHLSDFVQKQYPDAVLCTSNNIDQLLRDHNDIIVYTSLGDLVAEEFNLLITKSVKVIFCPPPKWTSTDLQKHTEEEIFQHTFKRQIENFCPKLITIDKPYHFFYKWSTRISKSPQLWFCGDSVTQGVPGQEKERYGYIVSQQLNMPVSFLAKGGENIRKITDQILLSNIDKDDIVICGLSGLDNTPYPKRNMFYYLQQFINKFDILTQNKILYDNIICIEQIKLFCQRKQANLYFVELKPLQGVKQYMDVFYNDYWIKIDEPIPGKTYIDFNKDKIHPGALTHKYWAEQILLSIR